MLHEILRTICKMTETELLEAMNDLLTRYGLHPEMVKGETKKEGWDRLQWGLPPLHLHL